MIWVINIVGFLLVAVIVWWFWLYKPARTAVTKEKPLVIVLENGVYQPAHIQLPANQPVALEFFRKDASPCAEMVIFPALDISEELPVNKSKTVRLPPLPVGNYEFHCQMRMYRGEVTVA